MKILCKEVLLPFALGVSATLVVGKLAKSKCVHQAAVKTVAKALLIRDEAAKTVNAVKEQAEDIYAEAKVEKNKATSEAMNCAASSVCKTGAAEA